MRFWLPLTSSDALLAAAHLICHGGRAPIVDHIHAKSSPNACAGNTLELQLYAYLEWMKGSEQTKVAVIKASSDDTRLLARLMRAEAEGEGELGMLMVGNVSVNRVRADCLDFKNIRTVQDMVFQSPGGYEATQKGYFYQRARERDIRLAEKVIAGERYHPAEYSLWFFKPEGDCPSTWYNQPNSGRFKAHCFFTPTGENCPSVYGTF